MTNTTQTHHVTLTPRPDKVAEARELLVQCAERVAAKKSENGPVSWSAAYDEEQKHFVVEALFPNQEAVAFHQANIQDLVSKFGAIMAARPETVVRFVFSSVP